MFKKVLYNASTFGITQRSLMKLRDTLAERIYHELVIMELPTNDIVCGFLVLDYTVGEAVFTGNGFRTDRGGEGGSGYRAASALFAIYGLQPLVWDMVDLLPAGPALDKQLLSVVKEIVAEGHSPRIPYQATPDYIDHCVAL